MLDDGHGVVTGAGCAAAKNASSFAGSLTPGSASVPDATSTANGRVASIPAATVSGVSPPERISGTCERRSWVSDQSHVSPVPPTVRVS